MVAGWRVGGVPIGPLGGASWGASPRVRRGARAAHPGDEQGSASMVAGRPRDLLRSWRRARLRYLGGPRRRWIRASPDRLRRSPGVSWKLRFGYRRRIPLLHVG